MGHFVILDLLLLEVSRGSTDAKDMASYHMIHIFLGLMVSMDLV
jgi:hypothetical protein